MQGCIFYLDCMSYLNEEKETHMQEYNDMINEETACEIKYHFLSMVSDYQQKQVKLKMALNKICEARDILTVHSDMFKNQQLNELVNFIESERDTIDEKIWEVFQAYRSVINKDFNDNLKSK